MVWRIALLTGLVAIGCVSPRSDLPRVPQDAAARLSQARTPDAIGEAFGTNFDGGIATDVAANIPEVDDPSLKSDASLVSCPPATHRCSGACLDDTAVGSCGSSCAPCPSIKGGQALCNEAKCGGTCPRGQKLCLGECVPETQSCNGSCPVGSHNCGGVCADDKSVNSCGASACMPCATPAQGMAMCDGLACGISCTGSARKCGNECVTGCCTDADCPPMASKVGRCDTATRQCGYACSSGMKPCNGGCIAEAPGGCCADADCAADFSCGTDKRCSVTACQAGFKLCGKTCVPVLGGCCDDTQCMGNFACTSNRCQGMQCRTGFKLCGSLCIADSACCSDADCNGFSCVNNACLTNQCGQGFKPCGTKCIAATACCPMPENCFNGLDDDCDNASDCADSDCQPQAICVPSAPGEFMPGMRVGINDPCPVGYAGTSVRLNSGLSTGTACTGCSCTASPTVCKPKAAFYGTAAECEADVSLTGGFTVEQRQPDRTCSEPNYPGGQTNGAIEGVRVGSFDVVATCQNAGAGVPPTPTWASSYKFCPAGAKGVGCASGSACLPKAAAPAARCVLAAGANACAPSYPSGNSSWYTGLSDARTCSVCSCSMSGASCLGATLKVGYDYTCESPYAFEVRPGDRRCGYTYGPVLGVSGAAPYNGTCTSGSTVSPASSLTLTGQQTLCCQ